MKLFQENFFENGHSLFLKGPSLPSNFRTSEKVELRASISQFDKIGKSNSFDSYTRKVSRNKVKI